MSTRAITDFIAGAMDGKTFGNFPAVRAQAEFPAVSQAGQTPQLWVWPEEGEETRLAAPRGAGVKHVEHRIAVWFLVMWQIDSAHSVRDLVEGILSFWRTYSPMPVRGVTDSVTGQTSDILLIGERMKYEIFPPVATKSQRLQAHSGIVTLTVKESFSA